VVKQINREDVPTLGRIPVAIKSKKPQFIIIRAVNPPVE
jgi:hypothetical protein